MRCKGFPVFRIPLRDACLSCGDVKRPTEGDYTPAVLPPEHPVVLFEIDDPPLMFFSKKFFKHLSHSPGYDHAPRPEIVALFDGGRRQKDGLI
jgi:hypothetical protein